VTAGAATPYVEIAEMLPQNTSVKAGDTVKWITQTIKDPHTVTFPQGDNPSTEPIPSYCEGSPDVLQTGPPAAGPPCGDASKFEVHLNPAPVGPTTISAPTTVASSGIISNPPAPFPNNYSFKFPNAGSFTYQCRIHDHMTGTIQVLAAGAVPTAAPAPQVSATPKFTG
jgi:plastocyanin